MRRLYYVENAVTFERSKPFAFRFVAEDAARDLGKDWRVVS